MGGFSSAARGLVFVAVLSVALVSATSGRAEVVYPPEGTPRETCVVSYPPRGACASEPKVELRARFTPRPREGVRLPVALALAARIRNYAREGAGVPAVRSIRFSLDRGGRIDLGGIATCDPSGGQRRECGGAVVGAGAVEYLLQSADVGEPLPIIARIVVYKVGAKALLARVQSTNPTVPRNLRVRVVGDGRVRSPWGLEIAMPSFDEGAGALTSLRLVIRKDLGAGKGRISPLSERCTGGRAEVYGRAKFRDGDVAEEGEARTCAP
jgi:hypothetical protein